MAWQTTLGQALEECRQVDATLLPDAVLVADLEQLLAARDRIEGLIARRLEVTDTRDATVAECGQTTTMWLRAHGRLSSHEARQRMFVARSLARTPALADSVEAGEIGPTSARIVASAVREIAPEDQPIAAGVLLDLARVRPPEQVARAARHLLYATAATEAREQAEQRRLASRHLSIDPTFGGMYAVSGLLTPESGEALALAIGALAAPAGADDDRTPGQRRADALAAMARHQLACPGLPESGGERPQLLVTMHYTDLYDSLDGNDLQAAELGFSRLPISGAAVRRLACDAAVIPAVLGSDGAVLDIGRTTRTWPVAIRRAARLRDGGCTFPGCAVGLDRCELHHLVFWADGGPTSLVNSAHLCAFHHWLVHERGWRAERVGDTELIFKRPDGTAVHDPPLARAG